MDIYHLLTYKHSSLGKMIGIFFIFRYYNERRSKIKL